MHRYIAPLSILFLSCTLPLTASAATNARTLCKEAETNPAAFVNRPDFADRIVQMSTRCPELALAMTNTITGTIPGVTNQGKGKEAKQGQTPAAHSDLLDRLKVATKNLDSATASVAKAHANLERTIHRAKKSGLSEQDLQALYAMNEEDGNRRVLPDFTASKREALAKYVTARDRLADAEAKLDKANEDARPLVQKALELAGKAGVAQEDLAKSLDGLTGAERQAILDQTLSDANRALTDLKARISAAEADFALASSALKSALNSSNYKKALAELKDEEGDVAESTSNLSKAEARYAAADAAYKERLATDSRCNGNSCRNARNEANRAAVDLESAQRDLGRQTRSLEEARKDLLAIEHALNLAGLSDTYTETAATLAASQAAEALAKDAADDAARKSRELTDLLKSTADALAQADAASAEARAATAGEEAEVAAAKAALEQALAEANTALEGSAEELAALHAVEDAKVVLREALDALGAAQSVASDLTEEVAALDNAPAEVTQAEEAMQTASETGDAEAKDAIDTRNKAGHAIVEYHRAEGELRDGLAEDTADESAPSEDTTAGDTTADSAQGQDEGTAEPNT